MRAPRIAVVGVGHLGAFHVDKLAQLSNGGEVDLVAVVDVDGSKVSIAEQYGVPLCSSLAELDGIGADGVIVAAPTATHAEIVNEVIARGWHVLIEKPMAGDVAAARSMVEGANAAGLILQVGHSERFNPAIAAALEVADRPRFIVAERLGPFSGRSSEVDVIADLMIHDLDVVACLIPSPLAEVRAIGVPVLTDAIDMASVRLEFEDGSVAELSAGRASLEPSRKIRLFTVERYLSIDCLGQQVKSVRRLAPPAAGAWPEIVGEPIEVESRDALLEQARDFVRCIRDGATPRVDGAAGVRALEMVEAIRAALRIPLPP